MNATQANSSATLKVDRLSIIFGGILVLIILITAGVSVWSDREGEVAKWEKQALITSIILAENTTYQMSSAYLALDGIVERIQDRWSVDARFLKEKLNTQEFHQILKDKKDTSPHIDVISVIDNQGDVISTSRSFPVPVINLAERDYFLAQKSNPAMGVFTSTSVRNKITGKWTFYITRRLTGSDGEFIGVVVLGISPDFLTRFYEKISDPKRTSITLFRDDFTILARWPEQGQLMGKKNLTGTTFSLVHDQKKKSGVVISHSQRMSSGGRQESRMAAIQVLDNYPL
ncbi:MAG: cache domain-containing protein, partial [Undibacterium sp.]|nr:cache domain-containing protein [Undibacterium sp.]